MTPEVSSVVSVAERLGGDMFLAQTLFRGHRHFPGAFDDAPALMSWDALNTILGTHRLEPPRLRLSAGGEALPVHRYCQAVTTRRNTVWQRLLPAELHARLREGATLVLDAVDELHPALGDFAAALERFLRTGVQINLYASFTSVEGFGVHWDDHDVIAVQVDGCKRWRIWGPTRSAPLYRDTDTPEPPAGEPTAEVVMRPGDVLYVPRGWWHAVATDEGNRSLHLTCGLQTHTGADLLMWVADQLRQCEDFRTDLPCWCAPDEQAAYLKAVGAVIAEHFADVRLLQRYQAARDGTDPGRLRPSLPHLVGTASGPARLRLTAPRASLEVTADAAVLSAAGTVWEFAPQVAGLLRVLEAGAPVRLDDLAAVSGLTADAVAVVAAELVDGQAAAFDDGEA